MPKEKDKINHIARYLNGNRDSLTLSNINEWLEENKTNQLIFDEIREIWHSLDAEEEKIIKGALSYSEKSTQDILTPRIEVFLLEENLPLTIKLLKKIYESGHSRIPVYKDRKNNIVAVLYTKDLICNGL